MTRPYYLLLRYRLFNTKYYYLALCGPSWAFALFFTVYAWVMMNDDMLDFCTVLIGKYLSIYKMLLVPR